MGIARFVCYTGDTHCTRIVEFLPSLSVGLELKSRSIIEMLCSIERNGTVSSASTGALACLLDSLT